MKNKIFVLSIIFLPSLTLAAGFSLVEGTASNFKDAIMYILGIVYMIIPILISVAFIVFFWGLSKFVIGANNDQEVKKGKEFMLWGILALFILVSIRSILGLLAGDLEIGDGKTYPLLPTGGNVEQVDSTIIFDNPQGF